ncbi:hypothetical protein [Bartonella sp. CB178]|uniref:hypothetical protein n=1 Tax=Bartonella sp. CB178 TaxID=3112255 RepID=UPI00300E6D7E
MAAPPERTSQLERPDLLLNLSMKCYEMLLIGHQKSRFFLSTIFISKMEDAESPNAPLRKSNDNTWMSSDYPQSRENEESHNGSNMISAEIAQSG